MEVESRLVSEAAGAAMATAAATAEAADAEAAISASGVQSTGPRRFAPLSAQEMGGGSAQFRRVRIPAHRYTPLQKQWENILLPLVEHMKLHVRFNVKTRCVEMKTSAETLDSGALAKGADFVQAFAMGFEVQDAVALLRLDDLFVESFEVKDVKALHGDHMSRAIGRITGQGGKTKYAIENATRTRIVVADQRIHVLGSFQNLKIARDAICKLILGAPPGKVYNSMRSVSSRMNERF